MADLYADLAPHNASDGTGERASGPAHHSSPFRQDDALPADQPIAQDSEAKVCAAADQILVPDASTGDVATSDNMTAEDALVAIASFLKQPQAMPVQVVRAFEAFWNKNSQIQQELHDAWNQQLRLHVKIADMESEAAELKEAVQTAELNTLPDVIQLKSLFCDAAVAQEFTLLKEENKQLQVEIRRQSEVLQALQSKPSDPKGRVMVQRLQAVQEENLKLTSQLQAHDEVLTQLDVKTAEVDALQQANISQRAQLRALEGQVEDLVAVATAFQAGSTHGAFNFQGGKGRPRDMSRTGSKRRREDSSQSFGGMRGQQSGPVRDARRWAQGRPLMPPMGRTSDDGARWEATGGRRWGSSWRDHGPGLGSTGDFRRR